MNDNQFKPSICFLNRTGDITVSWDESNEDAVLDMVAQKMKEGYSFFILKPRMFGLCSPKKVRANSIAEVKAAGAVVVDDAAFDKMMSKAKVDDPQVEKALADGTMKLVSADAAGSADTVRRATSPQEVVRNQTVAVRRVVGG